MIGFFIILGLFLLVQEIDKDSHFSDACLDLCQQPITNAHSPVAYAVVAETHWCIPDVSHGVVETVLRYSQQTAYRIRGMSSVMSMKKACPRCRFLEKRSLQIAMGLVPDYAL